MTKNYVPIIKHVGEATPCIISLTYQFNQAMYRLTHLLGIVLGNRTEPVRGLIIRSTFHHLCTKIPSTIQGTNT
jgi:hypothetical protein